MAVFRIALTEDKRRVVNAERDSHPDAHVRRKMLVVWLLHCGLTRAKAAEIAGLNARVQGKQKHRTRLAGCESILQLRAAAPSRDDRLSRFFAQRPGCPVRKRRPTNNTTEPPTVQTAA